jgi:hypothetical protein
MAYTKNDPAWVNGGAPGISAERLNHLETQYDEAKADLDAKMHETTGHKHTGAAGDAPRIDPTTGLTYVPVNKAGDTMTGGLTTTGLTVRTAGNAGINLGRTDGVSSTPFIDFHSGATAVDRDARIIASGGTGVNDGGTLNVDAAAFTVNGNTVWHAGNDGAGSGLDADTVRGYVPAKVVTMSISAPTWTAKAAMPTARGYLAAAAPGNGKLYAVGGYDGSNRLATCEEYDPATNTWTTKAAMPTARHSLAAAAPGNGKLYAVGGYNGSYCATCEEYHTGDVTAPVSGFVRWPDLSLAGVVKGTSYAAPSSGTAIFMGADEVA